MKPALRHRLTLTAILLGGMALRVYRLGADSLWYDETVSTYLAGSPVPELIRHTAGDIHPPGYYLLLRAWLVLGGYPTGHADPRGPGLEFLAGYFSVFFGILLIALTHALARRLAGPQTALIAAGLVALSPYNVWYSQEVRMYTLAAGLGVVALYALLRAAETHASLDTAEHENPETYRAETWAAARPGHDIRAEGIDGQTAPGRFRRDGPVAGRPHPSTALRSAQDARSPILRVSNPQSPIPAIWWLIYALAAAGGMYTLYYFAFLLIPLNLWALLLLILRKAHGHAAPGVHNTKYAVRHLPSGRRPSLLPLLLANLLAALLYAPWVPIAYRQAVTPPVPPWRTAPALWAALRESWTALSLGQSAPAWLWPALLLTLGLYGLGLLALTQDRQINQPANQRTGKAFTTRHLSLAHRLALPVATFGPLALILLMSAITPLYHVRYLFTYSPAFYVVLGAGLGWLLRRSRAVFGVGAVAWLAAAAVALHAFWADPLYRADDHRAAVHFLRQQWRPGDVVVVNAGWAYTALLTYWDGPVAARSRLTETLPRPQGDAELVIVTTGHVDGDPALGWGDPRSDFFALPAETAQAQIAGLFERFERVWHYRIYDTVNDPAGHLRSLLAGDGLAFEEQTFVGEAYMCVQGFLPRRQRPPSPVWPAARFGSGLTVRAGPLPGQLASGETLYPVLEWETAAPVPDFSTSLRLVGPDGTTWAQGVDGPPAGSLYGASRWAVGQPVHQTAALPVPQGTPPGRYAVELVVYDPGSGQPWPALPGELPTTPNGLRLGELLVVPPDPLPAPRPALARFGPLALVEAASPATIVAPGGQIPVELLWQAAEVPGEPLVVVVQLLDAGGRVLASLEEEPVGGRYPTQRWSARELVRDRHTLTLPLGVPAGEHRLIVGVYRADDRTRLAARGGWFQSGMYVTVRRVLVK